MLVSVSALIRNTGVGEHLCCYVYIFEMYLLRILDVVKLFILEKYSIVDFPLYSIIEVIFC